MATAMLRRKVSCGDDHRKKSAAKSKVAKCREPNNNFGSKKSGAVRVPLAADKDDMLAAYQPWVIQTYGDLAKTKTITLKKYARIVKTLRGEETVSADNSKFRFWVKAKGFHVGRPNGYEAKPADAIVGRFSVCDADDSIQPVNEKEQGSAKDPPLYVPNSPFKNTTGEPVYRKVAIVENFFDIIYNVHVELEGRPGKHAGQKRTYRTITETYAFLPREAVTRFLLGCTECQKQPPRSPSPASVLPTPSPSPTLPPNVPDPQGYPVQSTICSTPPKADPKTDSKTDFKTDSKRDPKKDLNLKTDQVEEAVTPRSYNPLDVANLTAKTTPNSKKRHLVPDSVPKLWSPVESIEREQQESKRRRMLMGSADIDYTLPITTTYLKYMRSLGCTDEDALKFESRHVSLVIEHFLHDAISHYFHY